MNDKFGHDLGAPPGPTGQFNPKPDRTEEFVLPPRQVPSTSARAVGATLLLNLESWVLDGQSVREFLEDLQSISVVVIALMSDSAAAMILCQEYLKTYFLADLESPALVLYLWERCGLHQLARTTIMLSQRYNSVAPLYSLGKVFRMKRLIRALEKAIGVVCDAVLWEPSPGTIRNQRRVSWPLATHADVPVCG